MNGKNLSAAGPNYLPPFEKNYQGYIRCRCVPAATLAEDIAAHNILLECQEATPAANAMDAKDLSETPRAESPPLPAVVHGSHGAECQAFQNSSLSPADVCIACGTILQAYHTSLHLPVDVRTACGSNLLAFAIISIGPETDGIIDRFRFPNSFITRLRHMVWTVRSSCWLQTLQAPEWGLGQEEAESLFNALLRDLGGTDGSKVIVIYKCPVPDT